MLFTGQKGRAGNRAPWDARGLQIVNFIVMEQTEGMLR